MTDGSDNVQRFLPRIQRELNQLPLTVPQRETIARSLLENAAFLDSQGVSGRTGKLNEDSSFFDLQSRVLSVVLALQNDGLTLSRYLEVVAKRPQILNMSPDSITSNVHEAVAQFAGDDLTRSAFISAAVRQPALFWSSPGTMRANIQGTTARFANEGLTEREYLRAAISQSSLFVMSPETVERNIREAAERLGLETRPYLRAALKHPSLFTMSPMAVEGKVRGVVEQLGDGLTTATDYARAALKQPSLFGMSPQTVAANVTGLVERFEADGLTRSDYFRAALKQPSVFATLPDTVAGYITGVVDRYAADGMTAHAYLQAALKHPALFTMSPSTIARHIDTVLDFAERGIFHPPVPRSNRNPEVEHGNTVRAATIRFLLRNPNLMTLADDNYGLRETHQRLTNGRTDSKLLTRPRHAAERDLMAYLGHDDPNRPVETDDFVAGVAEPTDEQARRFVLRALMHAGYIKGGSLGR
jgi:hypothetical protein